MNTLLAHITHLEATSFVIVFTLGVAVGVGVAAVLWGWWSRSE